MSGQVEKWLKGWDYDDVDMILSACADDFVYDDPYDGRMDKAEFAEYFRAIPDGEWIDSDFVAQEVDGEETHWFWWAWKPRGASEWAIEGCSLTKAGPTASIRRDRPTTRGPASARLPGRPAEAVKGTDALFGGGRRELPRRLASSKRRCRANGWASSTDLLFGPLERGPRHLVEGPFRERRPSLNDDRARIRPRSRRMNPELFRPV